MRLAHVDALTAYLVTSPGCLDSVAIIAASTLQVDLSFVLAFQSVRLLLAIALAPQSESIRGRSPVRGREEHKSFPHSAAPKLRAFGGADWNHIYRGSFTGHVPPLNGRAVAGGCETDAGFGADRD
jgi:hypothetical protein